LGIAGIATTVAVLFWLIIPRRHDDVSLPSSAKSSALLNQEGSAR
jgi:hypothetical protein